MKSEQILIGNFIAYLLVFLFFLRQDKYKLGVGNLGFLWLFFAALSSYLFYIQPGYKNTVHYAIMTIPPFIFLFICLFLLYYPFRSLKNYNIPNRIKLLPSREMQGIINISLPFLCFLFIAYTYQIIHANLHEMGQIRADLFDNKISNPFFSSWIGGTINRLYGQTKVLLYCLSFYSLIFIKRKNIKIWAFILLPYIIGFEASIVTATRSVILFILLLFIFQLMLYKKFMQPLQFKTIKTSIIIIIGLFAIVLVAMSASRFTNDTSLFYYKYAGEAMINFNGLLFDKVKDTTNGMAYFWYLPTKLGFTNQTMDIIEKWDFILERTGVNGGYFYTIVGALIFEFGKIGSFLIICIICLILRKLYQKRLTALTMIILSWCTYHLIASVFLLSIQGDSGTLSMIYLIIFYYWMKQKSLKYNKLSKL